MFKIYSEFDCLLKYDNKELFLDKNEHLSTQEPVKIEVYPIGNKRAVSFILNLNLLEKSPYYKFTKFEKDTLIFFVESLPIHTYDVFSFPKLSTEVIIGKDYISLKTDKIKKVLQFPFSTYTCKNIKNLVVCTFENKPDLILIFNPKSSQIKVFSGYLQEDNTSFLVKSEFFDSEFVFTENGLKLNSFVQNKTIPEKLLPFEFMVALKNQNYSFAYSLLAKNVQNSISIKKLKEFLPNVSCFKFIKENQCFALSQDVLKLITFSVENNKIIDLESD